MMWLLLVAAAVTCVASQVHWGDPCYIYPRQDAANSQKNTVEIPSNCTGGSIAWDYPSGDLNIHLHITGKSYSLCLVDSPLTMLGSLLEISGGVSKDVPLPTPNNPTCTDSINGDTQFVASASKTQYYYTWVDFTVEIK